MDQIVLQTTSSNGHIKLVPHSGFSHPSFRYAPDDMTRSRCGMTCSLACGGASELDNKSEKMVLSLLSRGKARRSKPEDHFCHRTRTTLLLTPGGHAGRGCTIGNSVQKMLDRVTR